MNEPATISRFDRIEQIAAAAIDRIEQIAAAAIEQQPAIYEQVDCPLVHHFTPGLYSREITMYAGVLVTSEKHKYEHQFILSQGVVSVWTEAEGEQLFQAPFHGITKPGTRRILYIHETAVWTTFHSTLFQTIEEIHDDIIEKYENHSMNGHFENNKFVPMNHLNELT